jgi:hypothetical protein
MKNETGSGGKQVRVDEFDFQFDLIFGAVAGTE